MSSVFYHGPDVSLVHRRDCFEDMAECVKTQSQTIRTSSDGGRVSVSYQRASRDWDIRRQAGREVAGGSRARYMDGYSRHSPLPKQQQYLDTGSPQRFLGQGSLHEQLQGEHLLLQPQYPGQGSPQKHFPDVQQQFPLHGQRFHGQGALQEQFPGQKYQLQQQIPVSWHGGQ